MSLIEQLDWTKIEPYEINSKNQDSVFLGYLNELTAWHHSKCENYRNILETLNFHGSCAKCIEDLPYLPARIFKEYDMLSIGRGEVFKTLTSSGTSGQSVSSIFLDKFTAQLQTKILAKQMVHLLGGKRLPMLVIDSPSVLRKRDSFSARAAGVLGFSIFGKDVTYALDEEFNLNEGELNNFLGRHEGEPIFIFGFTFMIWEYLVKKLEISKLKFCFKNATILHGGGWKKLQDISVSNSDFKKKLEALTGVEKVVNYYGMVEQTGSLFFECVYGHLHSSSYNDLIVRSPFSFEPMPDGQTGLVQVLSILPQSYPGHSILTEDEGVVLGNGNCKCGLPGKFFNIHGRVERAEVRGCSDTHEVRK